MKLYLSSYHLGSEPEKFAELFTENKKVAIIMNAADVYDSAGRSEYLQNEIAALGAIGLAGEDLDLRDYFGKPTELSARLGEYGGVWALGGNSFVLRRAMQQSGFDQIAPTLIKDGQLVYGGFSAGAIAATSTLKGVEIADDPHALPEGYDPNIVWEGLGLHDKSIAPHYRSEHRESPAIEKLVEYFDRNAMPYVALRDGEAVVVNN